jgi:alginate O-acetyltransferase complex protein AlgI
MLFVDAVFLYYFLPLFLALYFLAPRGAKEIVLTLASYVFYGWWRPDFVLLMVFSTLVDYSCGRAIGRSQAEDRSGKKFVVLSCCVNLGLLAYFKYANFGIESLNAILVQMGATEVAWTSVILPVGISFYTFQTLSYTVDVYRRDAEPVRSFSHFACYVAMFPQLIAGPIVRYRSVAEQLHSRTHTWAKVATGLVIFQAGLVKKVLLADLFGRIADAGFASSGQSMLEAWAAAVAYTFQIYFDFSGYSDMAIGLGLIMGFRFPINFDRPYTSKSITEFWRRWHISLSSFLRDYLYIPLGGNKKGPVRTYVNLGLTMLLGGLWHGAAWTFIAWGVYQGAWLVFERLCGRKTLYASLPSALQNGITFIIVVCGWVLFRAETLGSAARMLRSMFTPHHGWGFDVLQSFDSIERVAFVVAPIVIWGFSTTQEHARRLRGWWVATITVLFFVAISMLHSSDNVPFLYFQF